MTEAQAAAYRAERLTVAKKVARKAKRYEPWERLIKPAHSSPEPGIEIIDVGCYLPSPNEKDAWLEHGQAYLAHKIKKATRDAVLSSFHAHLPHWCVDMTEEARAEDRAASLRRAVKWVLLSRVSPGKRNKRTGELEGLDGHDNLPASCKNATDAVFAWLVNGPVFDVDEIGTFDDIVRSSTNPRGRVELSFDQEFRPAKRGHGRFGVIIELHSQ